MKVKFWGVRGSVPTPDISKLKVGGNTSCIEVAMGTRRLVLDMGTGVIALGKKIAGEIASGTAKDVFILLSHTHWDHIQGFPFFAPVFMSNANVFIIGPSKANRKLENILAGQMEYDYFPVKFSHLPAKIKFIEISEGMRQEIEGMQIIAKRHIHPGVAFGYRIEHEGKSMVYSTDTEHFHNVIDKRVLDLSLGADLLIHDAQYTDEEIGFRLGWGHSTAVQACQVAIEAKVKKLALFHHDPDRKDDDCFHIEQEARKLFPGAFLATEGMEIEL
jgi:phosphoribosyl 1,2-cyclic phosphodiesterase